MSDTTLYIIFGVVVLIALGIAYHYNKTPLK